MPAGVGRTLREARIRAGVELTDVQAQTGIKAKYLRALEWERFDLLPDFDYAHKAAKAEARVLQLDPESMSAELDRTIATVPRYGPSPEGTPAASAAATPEVTESVPAPATDPLHVPLPAAEPGAEDEQRSRSPWSATGASWRTPPARGLVVAALVVGLLAFLIVDLVVLRDDESSSAPAPAQPVDASPPTATPPAPSDGVSVNPGTAGADPPDAGPVTSGPGSEQGASASSDSPADTDSEAAAEPATDADDATGSEPSTSAGGPPTAAPSPVQQVEIRTARGESWIQVRRGTRTGPVLYEGLLPRGRTLNFEERALYIRAGAVAAIDIRQDGTLVSDGLEGTLDLKLTQANGLRVVS